MRMGVDTYGPGWHRNRGVRFFSHGTTVEIDWRENTRFPGYGLTRSRHDFDEILAQRAVKAGARLHRPPGSPSPSPTAPAGSAACGPR